MFTVVTDKHSVAISVQAVDDAGYSLVPRDPLKKKINFSFFFFFFFFFDGTYITNGWL